jgi:predicted nucleotidyltransferase
VYSLEARDAARDRILDMAASDERVTAAAVVGSLAYGGGDRWSDLDLTFAVSDGESVSDVLSDWTRHVVDELDAVVLFDLPSDDTIYRVFLLPGCLQVDLSFTPASRFGAGGPRFRLLFGEVHERPYASPTPAEELFGWGVAYARDARACIERMRWWQAEYCISAIRDHALALGCRRRNLATRFGRGFDDLPDQLLKPLQRSLVSSLTRETLFEAFTVAVEALLRESVEAGETAAKAAPRVRELLARDSS